MPKQAVHPALAAWLAEFNALVAQMFAAGYKPTAIGAREALAGLTRQMVSEGPPIAWVNDDIVAGGDYPVPVRIYHPAPDEARPVLLFLHGGGHTAGSVSVYDPISRRLAAASGHVVVVPEYRLAPENPYPAALNDSRSVIQGVFAMLQERRLPFLRRLSLAGDSAGAALAASVSAWAQHEPEVSIHRQVLIYPSVDYTMSAASMDENGEGYFLTKARIAWYFKQYFQQDEDRCAASPLYQPVGARMPVTLVISAGFDPLRDEAAQYVRQLQQADIRVEHLFLPEMVHAFLNLEKLVPQACAATYQRIADFLR